MADIPKTRHTEYAAARLDLINEAKAKGDHYAFSQLLADHEKYTLPVFVNYGGRLEVIVCAATEPFDLFMGYVSKLAAVGCALSSCKVDWGREQSYPAGETVVTSRTSMLF